MGDDRDYFAPTYTLRPTHHRLIAGIEILTAGVLCLWGFVVGPDVLAKLTLGLGLPLLVVLSWLLFARRNARFPLSLLKVIAIKVVTFLAVVVALLGAGQPALAGALGAIAAVNVILVTFVRS